MTDIARERRLLAAQGLRIVHREDVGAIQRYTSDRTVHEPVKWFFLHISVTQDPNDLRDYEDNAWRAIERIGQERFGLGFPYNACAFDTGRLYEGQPLTRRGAHTVNNKGNPTFGSYSLNRWARALVFPQMVDDPVTNAQVDAAARWAAAQIRSGMAERGARWYGHRDVAWKDCPGTKAYRRINDVVPTLNALTAHYVRVGLGEGPEDFGMTDAQYSKIMSKLTAIEGAVNGTRFVTQLLWDMSTPNGFRYVNPKTGEIVSKHERGARPALDIWRWAREAGVASRDDEEDMETLVDLIGDLKQLNPDVPAADQPDE